MILDCAKKVLSETESLPNNLIIKKVIESQFSISDFVNIINKEKKISLKFKP